MKAPRAKLEKNETAFAYMVAVILMLSKELHNKHTSVMLAYICTRVLKLNAVQFRTSEKNMSAGTRAPGLLGFLFNAFLTVKD